MLQHVLFLCIVVCWASTSLQGENVPTLQRTPQFSYDTVPVFAHVTKTTPFNSTDLDLLVKFQIVQFDKGQSQSLPGLSQEERYIAASKQIKAKNPEIFTLQYYNSVINFKEFSLYNKTLGRRDLLLTYPDGKFVPFVGKDTTTFDLSSPGMRQLIVEDCLTGINQTFDGCFFDRANWAKEAKSAGDVPAGWTVDMLDKLIQGGVALLKEVQGNATQKNIVLAKENLSIVGTDWKYVNAMMVTDTYCSHYGNIAKYHADQCAMDIATVQNATKRGQLTQVHTLGTTEAEFTFGLGTYLVAMGNMSYFSYQERGAAWMLSGLSWHKEYDYPLGQPKGDAVKNGWEYTRQFTSGTQVWVDIKNLQAKITWGHANLNNHDIGSQG